MMLPGFSALFLTMFLFDLHQSIFQWSCESVQLFKNNQLLLKVKNFFDKVLEFEKMAFSNIPIAN